MNVPRHARHAFKKLHPAVCEEFLGRTKTIYRLPDWVTKPKTKQPYRKSPN